MSDDEDYPSQILKSRREKDEYFWNAVDSPIPDELRTRFRRLEYFPVDAKFRVSARLTLYKPSQKLRLLNSTGSHSDYLKYGRLEFTIDSARCALLAFKSLEPHGEESLFVPFRDKTSGRESYPAARYLDIPLREGPDYVLDFNLAYNPYCAYSEDYICPFPPPENTLPVEIAAGEKRLQE